MSLQSAPPTPSQLEELPALTQHHLVCYKSHLSSVTILVNVTVEEPTFVVGVKGIAAFLTSVHYSLLSCGEDHCRLPIEVVYMVG